MTHEHPHETGPDTPLTEHAHTQRPRLTLRQAGDATGVSRSTIRRRLDDGAFPHATKDDQGSWRIPIDDLLAAGLTLARTTTNQQAPSQPPSTGHAHPEPERVHELEQRITELQAQLTLERAQRTAAEHVATERAEHLDTARRALRMLEASPTPTGTPQPTSKTPGYKPAVPTPTVSTPTSELRPAPKASFWKRLFS